MNCPECGAQVAAGERFCGNCGTPLQASAPDPGRPDVDLPDQGPPTDDVELASGQDAAAADEAPVSWNAIGEETIYSEPTQLSEEPMPLPVEETFVPDPAGSPGEPAAPSPPPPPPVVTKGSSNKKLIIAIVVLVVLLLCCCIALVVGGLYLSNSEEGNFVSMLVPNLMATI
jgi:hypothetical protein